MSKSESELIAKIKEIAPGYYVENDGGDYYCVVPTHDDRIGEDFKNKKDALKFILWMAGEEKPEGWEIGRIGTIAADLDCGQGYGATIWTRTVIEKFPQNKKIFEKTKE